jgi:hypothetical protein
MNLKKCIIQISKFEPFNADSIRFAEAQIPYFLTIGFRAVHISSRRTMHQDVVVRVENEDAPKEAHVKIAWEKCRYMFEAWADACSHHDDDSLIGMAIHPYDTFP